jgi:hypothetical protein
MGLGDCHKKKQIITVILLFLCFGMLFAETHGVLGHAHAISFSTTLSACNTPDAIFIKRIASGQGSNNPSCNLCYCYRLLSQGLVSQVFRIIDSPSIAQAILFHRICPIQAHIPAIGNRGPPQA